MAAKNKELLKRLKALLNKKKGPTSGNPEQCDECGASDMIIKDYIRVCNECGVIDQAYDPAEFTWKYSTPVKYNPSKHFEVVLSRLEGKESKACRWFDERYIKELDEKLDGDYSLRNIYKHLPNKDQICLNYIQSQLDQTKKLYIEFKHGDLLRAKFHGCYEEYMRNPDMFRKRPCALNILEVVIDCYSAPDGSETFEYIKPFIYSKFKLSKNIYNRLKDV